MMLLPLFLSVAISAVAAGFTDASLEKHVDSLTLEHSFNAVKEAYWTGYPHHRRTPFALSPDGKSAYLAYLDQSETGVHIQQVDPKTFAAVGTAVTVAGGKEAGGLVAHNDGFALLTNEAIPSSTANAPPGNTPAAVIYRYTNGQQSWKTFLGGPGVHEADGLSSSPDVNGDLVYSEVSGLYGAYIVVTAYTGWAKGHFGDSVVYVNKEGKLQDIPGASSSWGCSHNTGIAFEAADEAPFASVCAADQGAIWLNTKSQGMSGPKISNEFNINGATNEAMGGMSGSYSSIARYANLKSYIFAWVSRGAINVSANEWLGGGTTLSKARTINRNVAIAQLTDKYTLAGPEATSQIGAADGDSQVNWITTGSADCSNAHVATFDGSNALVAWEEIAKPTCDFEAMGCKGAFTGTYFQLVSNGAKSGAAISSMDTFVAGDMVNFPDGRICWPYVSMDWKLDGPIRGGSTATKMSFACMSNGTPSDTSETAVASTVPSSAPATSEAHVETPAPVPESSIVATLPAEETPVPTPEESPVAPPAEETPTPSPEPTPSVPPPAQETSPVPVEEQDDGEEQPSEPETPSATPILPSSAVEAVPSFILPSSVAEPVPTFVLPSSAVNAVPTTLLTLTQTRTSVLTVTETPDSPLPTVSEVPEAPAPIVTEAPNAPGPIVSKPCVTPTPAAPVPSSSPPQGPRPGGLQGLDPAFFRKLRQWLAEIFRNGGRY